MVAPKRVNRPARRPRWFVRHALPATPPTALPTALLATALSLASIAAPTRLDAQSDSATTCARTRAATDTTRARATLHCTPPRYWRNFAAGAITSILAHEAAHVGAAIAVGGHPSFGFDRGRPTVYSGIDADRQRQKQFVFSSAGLDVQGVLDELVLDVPHRRGSAFERGILAGGIGTAYFYATIGRNARVSDITYIARTSSLSRTEASAIYAGIATVHLLRIRHDPHYDQFWGDLFAEPAPAGGLNVGLALHPQG